MILEKIAGRTRPRVEAAKATVSPQEMARRAEALPDETGFPFEQALAATGVSFIAEVKRASPSKGVIAADFPYLAIARDYEAAGARAISVLTEPEFFQGSDDYLREIAAEVPLPVLRKDFTIDEYQIDEAKVLGAAAILLIVALLDDATLARFIERAHRLGLSALVETHSAEEMSRALAAGARVVGVNNRDLRTFDVDLATTDAIAPLVPAGVILVAESGIATADDLARVRRAGADAVLVGETLMRATDKRAALAGLTANVAKIKICGLTRIADIDAVNATRPDLAGFVFAPSRRRITLDDALDLHERLHPSVPAVGVFVDAPTATIVEAVEAGGIDWVQLHGHETDETIRQLKATLGPTVPVIKAVRLTREPMPQETAADHLLLDSAAPGSGQPFDWRLIGAAPVPYLLAGGIDAASAGRALDETDAWGLDASSGVETDGLKDPAKIAALVARVRDHGVARRPSPSPHDDKESPHA
ncbi:MAG: indole-3-glycerol phosphate synthase TrpC [Propionibacteriaceae bacterium]|jgi:indole-3-glycerol phosphate synthase/phosphoribosylanthranilate isomerase|nr:indole-3-glycerol phosphate synthase TrpC [Propionibacteriaceae bacterium]